MRRGRLAPLALLNLVLAGALLAAVVFVVTPMAFAISAAAGAVLVGLGRLALGATEGRHTEARVRRSWPLQAALDSTVGLQGIAAVVAILRAAGLQTYEGAFLAALGAVVIVANLTLRRQLWGPVLRARVDLASPAATATLVLLNILLVYVFVRADLVIGGEIFQPDGQHAGYELSTAKSTVLGFPLWDLSYAGKPLSYHFLPPLVLSIAIERLGIDPLVATYRLFPVVSIGANSLLAIFVARQVGVSRTLAVLAVASIWLMKPAPPRVPSGYQDFAYLATFMVGYSLGLQVLLACLCLLLLQREKPQLAWVTAPLTASLLVSRGPFFITLGLSLGLIGACEAWVRRSARPLVFPVSMCVLALPLGVLLRDAHAQDQWFLGPTMWIHSWGDSALIETIPMVGYALSIPLNPIFVAGLLVVPAVLGAAAVAALARKPFTGWGPSDLYSSVTYPLVLLTMVGLVGLTVPTFIADAPAYNAYQFFLPSAIALWILTFIFLQSGALTARYARSARSAAWCILALLALCSTWAFVNGLVTSYLQPGAPVLATDLVRALRQLSANSEPQSVVLFGQHYQYQGWNERRVSAEWFGASFFRTGLSGRQTPIEGGLFKGISEQPDYPDRLLDNFRFYYHAVDRGSDHQAGWDVPEGTVEVTVGRAATKRRRVMLVRPLWISPHFNAFDSEDRVRRALATRWSNVVRTGETESATMEWLRGYVRRFSVGYVVFERGERPKAAVIEALGLREAQTYGSVTVYRLDPAGGQ